MYIAVRFDIGVLLMWELVRLEYSTSANPVDDIIITVSDVSETIL